MVFICDRVISWGRRHGVIEEKVVQIEYFLEWGGVARLERVIKGKWQKNLH